MLVIEVVGKQWLSFNVREDLLHGLTVVWLIRKFLVSAARAGAWDASLTSCSYRATSSSNRFLARSRATPSMPPGLILHELQRQRGVSAPPKPCLARKRLPISAISSLRYPCAPRAHASDVLI